MDISYAVEAIQNTCREFNEVAYRLQGTTPERARLIFEGAVALASGWESLPDVSSTPISDALAARDPLSSDEGREKAIKQGRTRAAALALASEWLLDAAIERAAMPKPAPSEARPS